MKITRQHPQPNLNLLSVLLAFTNVRQLERFDFCSIGGLPVKQISSSFKLFCSGSVAEFYIKSPQHCIGDIDVMICFEAMVAIPKIHILEKVVPKAYSGDNVFILEIKSCNGFPGYVYLEIARILKWSAEENEYKTILIKTPDC